MAEEAPSGEELAERARDGDRRALARLLSEVENRTGAGEAGVRALYPIGGRAHLVGITGPPGTGKSTLVAAMIGAARRRGRSVAVIAVDPSSPITGGAILGDRVRMQAHAGDGDVFIRSMASRGHPGGLAATSVAAAAVLDGAGFTLVFLETVGAGQSEVEVASAADTTVVVEAPGMGDEIQAIKAGLLEVADIVVVNKGDLPGASRTAAQLRAMLVGAGRAGSARGASAHGVSAHAATGERASGRDVRPRPREPEVLLATAVSGDGVDELLDALERHRATSRDGAGSPGRLARATTHVRAILGDRIWGELSGPQRGAATDAALEAVASHQLDPYAAADRLLAALRE